MHPAWSIAAPVAFLCLWSGGYVVAKVAIDYAAPLTVLVVRYTLVVVSMGALFLVLRPALPKTRADWAHVAIVGILIQTVYFGFCYLAFKDGVAAGTVALLMSLQPILVAMLAPSWTGEHVGWRRWTGLVLGLAGAAIVILARWEISAPSVAGFAFCGIALAGMTGGTLWEKRFGLSHHPVTSNLIGFAAGLLTILPFALILESQSIDWTWQFSGAMAYLVIGNSLIATSLLLTMVRVGKVASVSALLFLVPPGAAVLAWFLLGEEMPPLAWAGMGLAGAGVLIATRARG